MNGAVAICTSSTTVSIMCQGGPEMSAPQQSPCPSHASCMQEAKWRILASHRSGETEDTFLADITVGLACGQLKSGALAR